MKKLNIRKIRLFTHSDLFLGQKISIIDQDFHYISNVRRLNLGDEFVVFNGLAGEWIAEIINKKKNSLELLVRDFLNAQLNYRNFECYFAPLKSNRHNYVIEKLTELGITSFTPIITEYSDLRKISTTKLTLRAKEAAEQCGLMVVPDINSQIFFEQIFGNIKSNTQLLFFDEKSDEGNPISTLQSMKFDNVIILIGPEGGFSESERSKLIQEKSVTSISLGSRILRADTASIFAAILLQITAGDIFTQK
tara:strand:- start:1423 stop:2172 length:750 start_codon:yes stop_codon:yes gene_type:complete